MAEDRPAEVVPYTLPELEHRAVERIAHAIGINEEAVVHRCCGEWIEAGKPPLGDRREFPGIPREQLPIWWIVRWWLRRTPAVELLDPAKLADELVSRMRVGDEAGATAAAQQIGRIAADLRHPRRRPARGMVLAIVGGLQEPDRSEMLRRIEQAEQLAIGASLRGGTEAAKA